MHLRLLCAALAAAALAGCQKDVSDPVVPAALPGTGPHLALAPGAVVLDPTGFAPLAARVTFTYPVAAVTKLVVHGKHGADSDVVQQFSDRGTSHVVPVLGLYADYANLVELQQLDATGRLLADTTLVVRTGPLPPNMPTSINVTANAGQPLDGQFALVSNFSAMNPEVPLIIDNYGDIRWLLNYAANATNPELQKLSYDCGIKRLQNGNFYFGDINSSKLFEVDAFGTVVTRWDLPGYVFHHEVYEKPDGNFLVSVSKTGSTHPGGGGTVEDYVVEVDRHANRVVQEWDLKQSLDENRTALEADPVDWLHVNALLYDPSDNTIIVSGRYQGVVKLTYDNQVKWILAPHLGWTHDARGQDLNPYLLAPLDAAGQPILDPDVAAGRANHPDFEWNWYQHSIALLPNGDLLLFDNGTNRNFIRNAPSHYSRAVEYRLDPVNRTVRQVWEYGKERGDATYSAIVSRVQYLPATNHLLFCPGYSVPNAAGNGGKIIEVDYASKQVLLEMEMTADNGWGFHRAQRSGLYP
ncbi:aryl-sulfate sulfotransferase [Hymenobacter caeli]|uniref:Arylsulfate sulfotransferase n=1 Tax=Hymenobacter caeli TaxID=2735894 RepID=A0ABX2FWP2_9BACT|nr:aryl-sulfate sulfotransferase [Hymenobacter caeli]NRT21198.1 arylsulfate sulfotransferase [Hymenobacter caeli]